MRSWKTTNPARAEQCLSARQDMPERADSWPCRRITYRKGCPRHQTKYIHLHPRLRLPVEHDIITSDLKTDRAKTIEASSGELDKGLPLTFFQPRIHHRQGSIPRSDAPQDHIAMPLTFPFETDEILEVYGNGRSCRDAS